MREFAFYVPEYDMICLQTIMEDCEIAFEWDPSDLLILSGYEINISNLLLLPLGEI